MVSRRRVTVGRPLAGGGEGMIFEVTTPPGVVLKTYRPEVLAKVPSLHQKLRALVAYPPAEWREAASGHVTLAWPSQVVLQNGRFAGFLMPAVNTASSVELHRVTNPSDRRAATGEAAWMRGFTWRYLVYTAANLAHATSVLHKSGAVIGDFNERNILVTSQARVTLIDCDSMQFTAPGGEPFFCRVGRPEFTPPELLNADWARTFRHPSSDLFALAIHVYQLLMEGEHPFRGVWSGPGEKPSVPQLALEGIWAHQRGGPLRPRPAAPDFGLLPRAVQEMFRTAFEDGVTSPARRPSGAAWNQALTDVAASLRQCAASPAHFYPEHSRGCPWCRREGQPLPRGGTLTRALRDLLR